MMSFQVCKVPREEGHKNDARESVKKLAETITAKSTKWIVISSDMKLIFQTVIRNDN